MLAETRKQSGTSDPRAVNVEEVNIYIFIADEGFPLQIARY